MMPHDQPPGPSAPRRHLTDWASARLGRTLVQVVCELHSFDGVIKYEDPSSLWLHFEGAEPESLHLGPEGESMRVLSASPTAFDMGEYGKVVVEDTTERAPWDERRLRRLTEASTVWNEAYEAGPSGVCLGFEGRDELLLINWGDEFYVGSPAILDDPRAGQFRKVPVKPPKTN